jgi:hypothetical protein
MTIRFPTEAANADKLRDDSEMPDGSTEDMPNSVGVDGTPRGRADGTPKRQSRTGSQTRTAEAKPDRDSDKS